MTADGGLFVCVSVFFFFKKAVLSFFDFWTFLLFFIFLFICALTLHKCQILMKAILSFFIFGPFFVVFLFFFSFLL